MFGLQDGLVSTTGVVVGVSVAVADKRFILLSAFVTIAVEALSMATGQYLSEKSVHDLPNNHHHDNLIFGGLFMFFAYLAGGIVPIIPILLGYSPSTPFLSIYYAFVGLFILGFAKAKIFGGKVLKSSLEMLLVGGLSVIIGITIGSLFKIWLFVKHILWKNIYCSRFCFC